MYMLFPAGLVKVQVFVLMCMVSIGVCAVDMLFLQALTTQR
jgi:hypothetical protein